jgi:pyruvate-ferredoxin/flavodoxin oxidoreductase
VESGVWPLYRFDPRRVAAGQPPLQLDCTAPRVPVDDYMRNEARFRMIERLDPVRYKQLAAAAQHDATRRFALYQQLAGVTLPPDEEPPA